MRSAERRVVAAVALAAVAVFADMYLTQPLLPALSREYGVSAAAAGTTISSVVLAIALTSSAYGPIGDFFGRKTTMTAGCVLLAFATLGCAFAPTFPVLVVLRGIQGLLVPSVSAVAIAYLGDLPAPRGIGTVVGIYIGASVAGGLLGRVVSGLIAEWSASWRGSFVAFAALTLAAALALRTLPESPIAARQGRIANAFAAAYRDMGAHLFDSRLLGAFVVGASLFFGFIGVFTYLPYLLSAPPYSLSTGAIAWFYASYVAGIFTAPAAGRLSRRVSRRLLMAGGLTVALGGLALTALPSLGAIAAGTIVLCVGMFTAQAIAPAYVNMTARSAKGGASALYQVFYYVGAVLGSTLSGIAFERAGWTGVLWTCGASFAIGAVVSLLFAHDRESGDLRGLAASR
jgi:YNFM family putative membrane transporter